MLHKPEHLATMTTRSYTSTYFDNIPWNDMGYARKPAAVKPSYDNKIPEMRRILGNTNIYDYYPGGKKDPMKKVNHGLKAKARAAN